MTTPIVTGSFETVYDRYVAEAGGPAGLAALTLVEEIEQGKQGKRSPYTQRIGSQYAR